MSVTKYSSTMNRYNKSIWREAAELQAMGKSGTLREIYFRLKESINEHGIKDGVERMWNSRP